MNGLRRATGERRVLVWSAEDREQADLAVTPVAGLLSEATGPPTIGDFLNDGTGAKLGYYLHNTVALGAGRCRPDGRREPAVTITLHYTAPSAGLPAHVKGIGVPGRPYALQTNVLVFAPAGGGGGRCESRRGRCRHHARSRPWHRGGIADRRARPRHLDRADRQGAGAGPDRHCGAGDPRIPADAGGQPVDGRRRTATGLSDARADGRSLVAAAGVQDHHGPTNRM